MAFLRKDEKAKRRQDYKSDFWFLDGSIYGCTKKFLFKYKSFVKEDISYPIKCSKISSWDIDTFLIWQCRMHNIIFENKENLYLTEKSDKSIFKDIIKPNMDYLKDCFCKMVYNQCQSSFNLKTRNKR